MDAAKISEFLTQGKAVTIKAFVPDDEDAAIVAYASVFPYRCAAITGEQLTALQALQRVAVYTESDIATDSAIKRMAVSAAAACGNTVRGAYRFKRADLLAALDNLPVDTDEIELVLSQAANVQDMPYDNLLQDYSSNEHTYSYIALCADSNVTAIACVPVVKPSKYSWLVFDKAKRPDKKDVDKGDFSRYVKRSTHAKAADSFADTAAAIADTVAQTLLVDEE